MIKKILTHSIRSFNRQRAYLFINVLGLSIGIACSLLIALFVINELSFDQFHTKKERIYRVNLHGKIGGQEAHVSSTASPVGPTMVQDYPEVESFTRYNSYGSSAIKYKDLDFDEHFVLVDSSFFKIFSIPLIKGDISNVLNAPYQAVISKSTAERIFGSEDPIGKMIQEGTDTSLYEVVGIMEDIPENSSFEADIFGSFTSSRRANDGNWLSNSFETYVLLNPGTNPDKINEKFPAMIKKYVGPMLEQYLNTTIEDFFSQGNQYYYELQPLVKIHLDPGIIHEVKPPSDPKYLYIFGSIAFLIIVIAAINFMNLSTAQAAKRAKEVGIKKVSGSSKGMLIRQFLSESIVLSVFSLAIAIVIIELTLPFFNQILNSRLEINYIDNWYTIPGLIVLSLLVGVLAGIYPAFYLSAFKPVSVLKGSIKDSMKNGRLRSILVILQFSISIMLIVGTSIIYKQINFMMNKDMGFTQDNLVVLGRAHAVGDQIKSFKNELLQIKGVTGVSASTAAPMHNNNGNGYIIEGRDQESFLLETNWVDYDYFKTYEIELSNGRLFDKSYPTDQDACIVNESAVQNFDLKDPFSTRFKLPPDEADENNEYMPIIGVVKNFHFRSLHYKIEPYIFRFKNEDINWGYVSIRLAQDAPNNVLKHIEDVWNNFSGSEPIQYFFMDDELKHEYNEEQQNATLAIVFTILGIVIASLGLFGLTSFTTEQRTKEIGIRKALGGSITNIFYIISKEIVVLVTISAIIAWPAIYFIAKNWLQNYPYKISLSPWDFILGFAIALVIAILTITYKTLKVARINPAQSLRYE
ncbi:MAG: ABC transporter permease [Bacteroidetes bacterium]|nr:ABC transporter permease [Bacteroidota bacterium]